MTALVEEFSTLTERIQTTVPSGVRRQLKLGKGDRIRYCTEPTGRIYIERVRPQRMIPRQVPSSTSSKPISGCIPNAFTRSMAQGMTDSRCWSEMSKSTSMGRCRPMANDYACRAGSSAACRQWLVHLRAFREIECQFGILFDESDRYALGIDFTDDLRDLLDDLRSETHGRFVYQEEIRFGHEDTVDHRHLLFASRHGLGQLCP